MSIEVTVCTPPSQEGGGAGTAQNTTRQFDLCSIRLSGRVGPETQELLDGTKNCEELGFPIVNGVITKVPKGSAHALASHVGRFDSTNLLIQEIATMMAGRVNATPGQVESVQVTVRSELFDPNEKFAELEFRRNPNIT